jgi:hypothetical protein
VAGATLIGMIVALASGALTLKQARMMVHDGVSLADGGGWAALFFVSFLVHLSAVAYVLSS